MTDHTHGEHILTTDVPLSPVADAGQEHAGYLRTNALSLLGNIVIALGSVAPTASIALTLSAIVAVTGYASPIAVLFCAIPMLGIALAYRRLNLRHVNCGPTYVWGGRGIPPYLVRVGRASHLAVLRLDDGLGDHPRLLPGGDLDRVSDRPLCAVAGVEPLAGLERGSRADWRHRYRRRDRRRLRRHQGDVAAAGPADRDRVRRDLHRRRARPDRDLWRRFTLRGV